MISLQGITTYEYVVAVRAQPGESPPEDEVITSTSAGSTVPGMSRSSSLGLQQHGGGWCTPPRIFVEHQVNDFVGCILLTFVF